MAIKNNVKVSYMQAGLRTSVVHEKRDFSRGLGFTRVRVHNGRNSGGLGFTRRQAHVIYDPDPNPTWAAGSFRKQFWRVRVHEEAGQCDP